MGLVNAQANEFVIIICLLVFAVILAAVAFRTMRRGDGPMRYFAISSLPLLLTIVIPMPFAVADRGRPAVLTLSYVGLTLSFILFTLGAVLTLRAALAGDRRAAGLLALETALAGLPAGIVTAYATLALLL